MKWIIDSFNQEKENNKPISKKRTVRERLIAAGHMPSEDILNSFSAKNVNSFSFRSKHSGLHNREKKGK